jgi:hypothetical protein
MNLRHLSTALCVGLLGASGCFEDPLPSLTTGEEETGDGDGDFGDGDGDGDSGDGDGDGDSGDGDGDGDSGDGDCNPGATMCGGICVDTDIDSLHCGDCDNECPPMTLCGEGMCKPEKYVFVTDALYPGNFGALEAEIICNEAALAAALPPGPYKAWISTMADSPSDWLAGDGVYRLRQGEVVAYSRADLIDGTLNAPINRTEFGELLSPTPACNGVEYAVWTGTSAEGASDGPDCMGWSNNLDSAMGRVGNAASTDPSWSDADCTPSCSLPLPLYCIPL